MSFRANRGLGARGLVWGEAPLCVFWQGHLLCVNEAELKESFTERGSAKGMCRM